MFNELKNIIESNAQELALMKSFEKQNLNHFKNGRLAYFRNDPSILKKCISFLKNNESETNSLMKEILGLRLKIRTNGLTKKDIENIQESSSSNTTPSITALKAEYYSVLAISCDILKDFNKSFEMNMKSYELANNTGLKKKASIVFYNSIVAQNHNNTKSQRLHKLNDSIKIALDCEDFTTAIAAHTSLSNEYLALDCIELSYKEILIALELAKDKLYGSFNHCFCLLAHAEVCISLNRVSLAKENLKILKTFNFKELKSKINELEDKILKNTSPKLSMLAGDEQKLVEILSKGSTSKYKIIDEIYGEGDFESFNNRFKQLLTRVKKKKGSIVNFNKVNSVYELVL